MEYRLLGNSNLKVSRLCFGALTIGPLQANLPVEEGSNVLLEAFERGINFVDSAELYEVYPYIKAALKKTTKEVVIASRSYAYTKEMAQKSIEKARHELDRDVIDIFGLHQQESEHTLRGHKEALEYIIEAKQKGIVRAVLITTHHIEVVRLAANLTEVDVIHPIVNVSGYGISDGTVEEMLNAIKLAYNNGKGIYSMKALGGGNLLNNYKQCLEFVLDNPNIHSIAVGMKNIDELDLNLKFFNGDKDIDDDFKKNFSNKELHIEFWCEKCRKCIKRCSENALRFENGKIAVDKSRCLLCGYCGSVCPSRAIKII